VGAAGPAVATFGGGVQRAAAGAAGAGSRDERSQGRWMTAGAGGHDVDGGYDG
jgi:hypothetical protein